MGVRGEKRDVENFAPSKKTVEAKAALHPFPPPHPSAAPKSNPSKQGGSGFLSPGCVPARGGGHGGFCSERQLRASSGHSGPRPTGAAWGVAAPAPSGSLGCKWRQLPSLAGAHRLDTGGNVAKEPRREVEEAEKGDCKIPLKIDIVLAPRAAA